ncbi:unnamed protein product, partial [Rotaria socialis]
LTDDALDYYLAHEDMIFNFYDLRKLLLHKQNVLAPLRTLPALDSIATLSLTAAPPVLTFTQLPTSTTDKTTAMNTYTFAQSLEDLTQNDIRKKVLLKIYSEVLQNLLVNIDKTFLNGALDWFQDSKTNFKNSWSVFVDHFKKTFDSPTRARIAMKKLNSYAQSPNQDVRSFCSEIRKLFSEAGSHMSFSMKLEFLLAKVNPTYRLDLLKQKPKDPTEFEALARDIENIYLVHEAIEQNTQFNTSCSASTSALLPDSSHQPLPNYQQSPRTTNYNSNNRYTSSFHNKANYSPQFSFRPSSRQHHTPSFQSSTNRQFGSAANPRNITRQNLFNFQIPSSTQQ